MTELALIVPVIALLLLTIVVLSGAVGAKFDLQAATAQGARVGAIEGNGGSGAVDNGSSNTVDTNIINAILGTHGVDRSSVSEILIYKAGPDGAPVSDGSGGPPPENLYQITPSSINATLYNWPLSDRHTTEPADSVGVRVYYTYHPVVSLPGFSTIQESDQSVERLNPTSADVPCPIPGVPTNVVATATNAEPSSSDTIAWDAVPGASSYTVYANVNGAGYVAASGGTFTTTGNRVSYVWDKAANGGYSGNTQYAPTQYEVSGTNFCGEGDKSLATPDQQCTLPSDPLTLSATAAVTPSTDLLTWTWSGPWSSYPVSATYQIAQTSGGSTNTFAVPIPLTGGATPPTSVAVSDYDTGVVTYQMSALNGCGVSSATSNTATRAASALYIDAGSTGGTGSWSGDSYYASGNVSVSNNIDTSGVSAPAPLAVYQTQHVGTSFTYAVGGLTPNQSYTVILHFAELQNRTTRKFTVKVDGASVPALTNLNVYAAAGGFFKALAEQTTATADANGTITLQFTGSSPGAVINGIEIH